MRSYNRGSEAMRPVQLTVGVSKHAEGSVRIEFGDTVVLVTASIEEKVPPHVAGTGAGWVTAEYGMLPRATGSRTAREAARGKQTGRTMEIQRLIGRALRACVDLKQLGPRTVTVDCDVLQADGGTRTASITGGYVALALALRHLHAKRTLPSVPALTPVAAVSVGIVNGAVAVDLDYVEDSTADVDLNIVALEGGRLVEVQGTGEHGTFSSAQLQAMLGAGLSAIDALVAAQRKVLG